MNIKVAFYIGGGSLADKLIQWWTANFKDKFNGDWKHISSHVEISIKNQTWCSASTRYPFKFRCKDFGLVQSKWRVYNIQVTPEEVELVRMQLNQFKGMSYDWVNIFGSDILKLNVDAKNKVTCDEVVARCLYLTKFGKDIKHIPNLNPKRLEDYIIKWIKKKG